MPDLGEIASNYFSAFATFSMWFLIGSTVAYSYRRYTLSLAQTERFGLGR